MYRSKYRDSAFTVKGWITLSFKNTKHGEGVGYSSKFLQDPDSCSQKNLKPNENMISARICIHTKKVCVWTLGPLPVTWMLNCRERFDKYCWVSRYHHSGLPTQQVNREAQLTFPARFSSCLWMRVQKALQIYPLSGAGWETCSRGSRVPRLVVWSWTEQICQSTGFAALALIGLLFCVCVQRNSVFTIQKQVELCVEGWAREENWSQILNYCSEPQLE